MDARWRQNDARSRSNKAASTAAPVWNVRPDGVDMTQCDQVRSLFSRCRNYVERGRGRLVIDLRGIDNADTKLAACLVAIFRLARSTSVRVELMLSEIAWNVLSLCRLDEVMATAHRPAEPS